jgi:hypothetical protein
MFIDRRNEDESGDFLVLPSTTGRDLGVGEYSIGYRMYYAKYTSVIVESATPFVITVIDACGMDLHNSL